MPAAATLTSPRRPVASSHNAQIQRFGGVRGGWYFQRLGPPGLQDMSIPLAVSLPYMRCTTATEPTTERAAKTRRIESGSQALLSASHGCSSSSPAEPTKESFSQRLTPSRLLLLPLLSMRTHLSLSHCIWNLGMVICALAPRGKGADAQARARLVVGAGTGTGTGTGFPARARA